MRSMKTQQPPLPWVWPELLLPHCATADGGGSKGLQQLAPGGRTQLRATNGAEEQLPLMGQ